MNKTVKKINIKAIEASEILCKELSKRWNFSGKKTNIHLEIRQGLVGPRHGTGYLFQFDDHGLNSTFRNNGKSTPVKHINLTEACSSFQVIDLLKCDIEGGELGFLENYPDILQKTQALVVEFHPEFCSIEACEAQLKQNGFMPSEFIKDYGNCFIQYFKKPHSH
jgi:FkbM family methyltransferase